MKSYADFFRGKRITLLGLGVLGRGVGDAEFLAECGARVLVTDKKTEEQLGESVARLRKYPNISFRLGGHDAQDFTNTDLVIKAAGVRLDSPEVEAARAAGVPIAMSTALFAKHAAEAGVKIVGVTGTRGKSTVTHMISHVLVRTKHRVFTGGNVRGISTLALLPEVEAGDIAVLELDSWQLQGFGDLKISPHIAVFTNLMPDHQNYYASMDEYFTDKANIFLHQKPGDALIIGPGVEHRVRAAHSPVEPIIPGDLAPDWMLQVPGDHNRHNAALAANALLALGLMADKIRSGLESFEGIEGRLQLIREKDGVRIYNDNNATTPEATIAALRALRSPTHDKNIVLIMGGSDKGLDMSGLLSEIFTSCKKVILLAGTGSDQILKTIGNPPIEMIGPVDSLAAAVEEALHGAEKGDIVLFSPAFASFGMFKNEYDRNDQFMRLITQSL